MSDDYHETFLPADLENGDKSGHVVDDRYGENL